MMVNKMSPHKAAFLFKDNDMLKLFSQFQLI
jgi:hypothetical protein